MILVLQSDLKNALRRGANIPRFGAALFFGKLQTEIEQFGHRAWKR